MSKVHFNTKPTSDGKTIYPDRAQNNENRSGNPHQKFPRNKSPHPRSGSKKDHGGKADTPGLEGRLFKYGVESQQSIFLNLRRDFSEWAVTEYDMGSEIYAHVMTGEKPEFDLPTAPADGAKGHKIKEYSSELDEVKANKKQYGRDSASFTMRLLRHCSTAMRRALENPNLPTSLAEHIKKKDYKGLLDSIESIVFHTVQDGNVYEHEMLADNWDKLFATKQKHPNKPRKNIDAHQKEWDAQMEALESMWGRVQPHYLVGGATDKQEKASNRFKAMLFLKSVDQDYYRVVINDLHSKWLAAKDTGRDEVYPDTVAGMVNLLKNRRDLPEDRTGASFAQDEMYDLESELESDEYNTESDESEQEHHQEISWTMAATKPPKSKPSRKKESPSLHPNRKDAWNFRAGFS